MAKKIVASERDSKAAEDALSVLEQVWSGQFGGQRLHVALSDLRPLLRKVARPRLSKPLRPH